MTPPMQDKAAFFVIGRAGMDLYADPPGVEAEHAGRFTSALGGSAANIAAGIVRLGGRATLISAVSDDSVGRFVRNELRRFGIDDGHVRVIGGEARTSLAIVETRPENCQNTIYRNNAADFDLSPQQLGDLKWRSGDVLIVTGTTLAMEPSRKVALTAMEKALEAGLTVALDLDYRPYSWESRAEAARILTQASKHCAVLVGNDEEFAVLAGPQGDGLILAQSIAKSMNRTVVYKRGPKGSITFAEQGWFETDVFDVKALKPTGAGDAFMSAFMMSLVRGHAPRIAVRNGTAAAAIVVTRVGCAPAMPTRAELEDFLKSAVQRQIESAHAHSAL
jgi:5-dehydro-2-deoxygluconokinase